MRLSNAQAVARPIYYDRNPTVRVISYTASGVAPHGLTVRASYTVPAGKKAYVEYAQISTRRDVVATAAGLVQPFIRYTPSGGAQIIFVLIEHIDNTQNIQRQQIVSQFGLLGAGDLKELVTFDGSTAGSNVYNLVTKLTEFDA